MYLYSDFKQCHNNNVNVPDWIKYKEFYFCILTASSWLVKFLHPAKEREPLQTEFKCFELSLWYGVALCVNISRS